MKERYEYLFKIYLRICGDPNNLDTTEQLRDRIRMTHNLSNQLYGMIALMKEMNVLNWDEWLREKEKVMQTFSTLSLFNAYIGEDGEVYSCRK